MNRGNITPRPENLAGVFGFPQIDLAGTSTLDRTTPGGFMPLIGIPMSPYSAPAVPLSFTLYFVLGGV